jgi:RHS repeat-associated protein
MESRHYLIALTIVTSVIAVSADARAAQGKTPGQFGVSGWGSAQYSIPIWAPPGPRGIQPQISIGYDSQTGVGSLGLGFSIGGLGAISRCDQTVAQDGTAGSVTLAASDVFCINGNRMRVISGTYGAAGSTYQTEIADFSLITANGTAGNGPASFTVKGRNGLIYQYGLVDANSNGANSQVLAAGSTTALAWLLSKVSDRAGNNYVINYLPQNCSSPATCGTLATALAGTSVPDTILWTPTSAGAPTYTYTMKFNYAANASQSSPFSFVAGTVIVNSELLTSIEVMVGTTVLKDYFLGYQSSPVTGREELISLKECADSAQANCLLPSAFAYTAPAIGVANTPTAAPAGISAARYDFNGDGIPDLVYISGASWFVEFGSTSGFSAPVNTGISSSSSHVLFGNLTGGKEDGLLVATVGGDWTYYLYNGSGFTGTSTGLAFDSTSSTYMLADTNGDGLPDLVSEQLTTLSEPPPHPSAVTAAFSIRLNTSTGGTASFSATLNTALEATGAATYSLIGPDSGFGRLRRFDFNGDGRDDLVLATSSTTAPQQTTVYALISNGTTFTRSAIESGSSSSFAVPYFLNWNNDTCTDFLAGNTLYIAGCNGTAAQMISVPGTIVGSLDWDGDGRTDLLIANGSTIGVYLSTGSGISALQSTSIPYSASCKYVAMDANGDGLDDLGCITATSTTYYPHNGVPDLVSSFSDGYGITYSPSYVPLANSGGIYTKGSSAVAPYQDYAGPLYVVSSYTGSDGIGGTYTNSYNYTGAIMNLQGRGFQGFTTIRSQDGRTQFFDTKNYSTVFPTAGMVIADSVTQSDLTNVSNGLYTPATLTINPASSNPQVFPYIATSTRNTYEVQPTPPGGTMPGTSDGQLITTTTRSVGTPDSAGNFSAVTTTVTDEDPNSPYHGLQWQTETQTTTTADFTAIDWCLNLPTEVNVTKTPPASLGAPAITRHTNYLSPDYANCRQTEQVIESGNAQYQVDTKYFYADDFGNMTSQTVTGVGMTARTSSVAYGTTGQFPVSSTNALGQTSLVSVDPDSGMPLSATDPNGISTSWQYDPFQRKIKETRPDATSTTWAYNSCVTAGCVNANNSTTVVQTNVNTNGSTLNVQNTYLDHLNRTLVTSKQMLNGAFDRNEVQYDNLGNIHQQSAPCTFVSCTAFWTVNTYDPLNRVISSQRPISATNSSLQTTSWAYLGRKTVTTDPLGKLTTTFTKVTGSLGRTLDQNNYYVNFNHDAFGAVISVTDSLSNTLKTTTYGYGIKAFAQSSVDMDLGASSYTFDALGELTAYSDAKGQSFTVSYDALSRPTERIEPDLTTAWNWGAAASHFNIGKLSGIESVAGTNTYFESYLYDSAGRLTSQEIGVPVQGTDFFTYAYSSITGLPSTLKYPTSASPSTYQLTAEYNYTNGILSEIVDANVPTTVWWQANTANPRGQITEETTEDLSGHPQIVSTHVYDAVTGLLSANQTGVGSGAALQNESYSYDEDGNLITRQNNNPPGLTETFTYDGVNRLSTSHLGTGLNLSITYDVTGNFLRRSDVANGNVWTYDPVHKHQVTEAGSAAFQYGYDANGNVISRNGSLLSWSSYNYPSGVSTATESATFDYGPNHQRWRMVYSGSAGMETTYYATPLFEVVLTSSPTAVTDYRHYIYANGRPVLVISRTTAGAINVHSLLLDQQGSISTIVADATGTAAATESFTAFGNPREAATWSGAPTTAELSAMNGVTREGYTFQTVLGSMGLNHMNGRIQDSTVGRFISADPFGVVPTNTQSFNRYSYVFNNPVSFVDPSGFVVSVCIEYENDDGDKESDCIASDPPPPRDAAPVTVTIDTPSLTLPPVGLPEPRVPKVQAPDTAQSPTPYKNPRCAFTGGCIPPSDPLCLGSFAFAGIELDGAEVNGFGGAVVDSTVSGLDVGSLSELGLGGEGPVGGVAVTTSARTGVTSNFGFFGGGISAGPLAGLQVGLIFSGDIFGAYFESHKGPFAGGSGYALSSCGDSK